MRIEKPSLVTSIHFVNPDKSNIESISEQVAELPIIQAVKHCAGIELVAGQALSW